MGSSFLRALADVRTSRSRRFKLDPALESCVMEQQEPFRRKEMHRVEDFCQGTAFELVDGREKIRFARMESILNYTSVGSSIKSKDSELTRSHTDGLLSVESNDRVTFNQAFASGLRNAINLTGLIKIFHMRINLQR